MIRNRTYSAGLWISLLLPAVLVNHVPLRKDGFHCQIPKPLMTMTCPGVIKRSLLLGCVKARVS